MAKPRSPKKSNGANPAVSTANTAPALSNAAVAPVDVVSSAPPVPETKTATRRASRKPAIVRTESRPNLVPINLEDEIRRLAYLLSERRGFEAGHETEDWLAAEHEIRQRYHQHSA